MVQIQIWLAHGPLGEPGSGVGDAMQARGRQVTQVDASLRIQQVLRSSYGAAPYGCAPLLAGRSAVSHGRHAVLPQCRDVTMPGMMGAPFIHSRLHGGIVTGGFSVENTRLLMTLSLYCGSG